MRNLLLVGLAVCLARGEGTSNNGTTVGTTNDGGTGDGPGGSIEPGIVKGVVLDTSGRPLPGANVLFCNPLYRNSCINVHSGSDGRYSFDLPPQNAWRATASITKAYNGRAYCLDLRPDSTESFNSRNGALRNFQWRLTGLQPDQTTTNEYLSFYGAAAEVRSVGANHPDLRYVRVQFIPEGSLVDGTQGHAFTASPRDWHWDTIGDIPLGRYIVSAEYVPPRGAKSALPVLVGRSHEGQYATSAVLDFDPGYGGVCENARARIYVRQR